MKLFPWANKKSKQINDYSKLRPRLSPVFPRGHFHFPYFSFIFMYFPYCLPALTPALTFKLKLLCSFYLYFCSSHHLHSMSTKCVYLFEHPLCRLRCPRLFSSHDWAHSRPQSPSCLGHVIWKSLVGYKLSRVALGTRMVWGHPEKGWKRVLC